MKQNKLVPIKHRQVLNNVIIKSLKKTIKKVEAGDVTGIAVVMCDRNDGIVSFYECINSAKMIGGTEWLRNRLMKDWENQ